MTQRQESASPPSDTQVADDDGAPQALADLEASNALLRAALARREDDAVRRDLVNEELKHRISNLLAVVGAMARHTFRQADPSSLEAFSARLTALAAAQKLLLDDEEGSTPLDGVVRSALAAYRSDDKRVTIAGPDVSLDGQRAHALTLALHELATNASKYGALSVDRGRVEVTWASAGGYLDFVWREHDGPAVTPPTRRGFGTLLVTKNLAAAFAGKVDLHFRTSGVECRLYAPSASPTRKSP